MPSSYRFSIPIMILLLLPAQLAWPDSYRCGRKLIRTGDSTGDLLRICGEPRFRDRGVERVRIGGKSEQKRVERWYYRKSPRSLDRVVLIHGGKVVAIEIERR
ncbi:MAG: DUF2845 domain-containing protein [Gammaproteobacteria bacterium]|nr:DUF2845 domain-containing protein [Gammaproteobacteria bacterium]NNK33447.1 DUF2845 domain-containing protein [Xanthomonadales bacterium]